MQSVQQRANGTPGPLQPERISWARAMIFAVGFFYIGALLIGQIPSYIYDAATASTLVGLETGFLALAAVCIAGFIVIQVIVLLFDPKPILPPIIFSLLGLPLAVVGLAIILGSVYTGNQYFPSPGTAWNSVLGGLVLWFPSGSVDFGSIGAAVLFVGVAMVFYSVLALREQRNPDRSDPGTTPAIRTMIAVGSVLLFAFLIFYTFVSDTALAGIVDPACPTAVNAAKGCPGPVTGLMIVDTILNVILGIAIFCALGAFALRLHYLMRPIRNRAMSGLYLVAVNLAQVGVIFLLAWFLVYPVITWIHSWTLVGLGDYLTLCGKISDIPQSCAFSQQGGYIIDGFVTFNFFILLMGSVFIWKSRRNFIVITGVVITAVLALATVLAHMNPADELIAMLVCGGVLILAALWTSVGRREFAVIGENNLGCIGQWLVVGTCLLIYLAAFGFFSMVLWPPETEPNVPFTPGVLLNTGTPGAPDAVIMFVLLAILAAIQFFFLVRNRYKV